MVIKKALESMRLEFAHTLMIGGNVKDPQPIHDELRIINSEGAPKFLQTFISEHYPASFAHVVTTWEYDGTCPSESPILAMIPLNHRPAEPKSREEREKERQLKTLPTAIEAVENFIRGYVNLSNYKYSLGYKFNIDIVK